MQERRDTAFLLRTYDLSETSLIVHWFGKRSGIVKTTVKGAKGKKSAYAGKLELFSMCEIQIMYKNTASDLHSLIGVEMLGHMSGIRTSYQKLLVASYFSSLLEYWLNPEQEASDIYDLFLRALDYIEQKEVAWKGVTHFEKELSRLLGYSTLKIEVQKIYRESPRSLELRNKLEVQLRGKLKKG